MLYEKPSIRALVGQGRSRKRGGTCEDERAGEAQQARRYFRSAELLERNAHVKLHFTPTYSSWLDQVEIWFARLEREGVARGILLR